jgi:hypothetical protein
LGVNNVLMLGRLRVGHIVFVVVLKPSHFAFPVLFIAFVASDGGQTIHSPWGEIPRLS